MATLDLPDPYSGVDALIEAGDLSGARAALGSLTPKGAPLAQLCEIKLSLREGALAPQLAMNRLLALMRADPALRGAQELYREASTSSYGAGASSLSHSHPPPPIKR